MILWREDPVPQRWRGLWRRLALERADGSGDTTSLVLWLQTDSLFVDLRIPISRAHAETFNPALAAQEGFAGRLFHSGTQARWDRRIDFAPTGLPDEGRLRRARRMLVEHGLHENYVEHWWLDAPGDETAVIADTSTTIAVRAGDNLMFAQERRPRAPSELTSAVAVEADLRPLLDCEISYARRDGATWRIAHSTLPWREGVAITAQELQASKSS